MHRPSSALHHAGDPKIKSVQRTRLVHWLSYYVTSVRQHNQIQNKLCKELKYLVHIKVLSANITATMS